MPSLEDSPNKGDARLLLVSNRLPITIKRSDDGKYDFSMSSGGLVSGLSGLSKSTTFQWYGWPGLEVPEDEIPVVTKRLKDEYGAIPVFIDDELADRHYNGFSSQSSLPLRVSAHVDNARGRPWRADRVPFLQIPSSGRSSTTTQAKLRSTSLPGRRIKKRTASSPRPLPRKCKMEI